MTCRNSNSAQSSVRCDAVCARDLINLREPCIHQSPFKSTLWCTAARSVADITSGTGWKQNPAPMQCRRPLQSELEDDCTDFEREIRMTAPSAVLLTKHGYKDTWCELYRLGLDRRFWCPRPERKSEGRTFWSRGVVACLSSSGSSVWSWSMVPSFPS